MNTRKCPHAANSAGTYLSTASPARCSKSFFQLSPVKLQLIPTEALKNLTQLAPRPMLLGRHSSVLTRGCYRSILAVDIGQEVRIRK